MRRYRASRRPDVGGLLMVGPLMMGLFCAEMLLASEPAPTSAIDHSILPAHLAPHTIEGLGVVVESTDLDKLRGGDAQNDIRTNGTVSDNHAEHVISGTNTLTGSAFSDATGINTVIQNSGSNVLIQNAMIVNVQFADPGL